MIVDRLYINRLRRNRIEVSEELEKILINKLGTEPEPYEFSEQDLYEQVRMIIQEFRSSEGRLNLISGLERSKGKG